jgi:hypothetical protein
MSPHCGSVTCVFGWQPRSDSSRPHSRPLNRRRGRSWVTVHLGRLLILSAGGRQGRRAGASRPSAADAPRDLLTGGTEQGIGRTDRCPAGPGRADRLGRRGHRQRDNAPHRLRSPASNHVRRGENNGRTLEEANIVRSMSVLATWSGKPLRLQVPYPAGQDFAVLLQRDDGHIVGAAVARATSSP